MYSTADFKRGLRIEYDGTPYSIVEFQHVKPGKGGAFVRTKLRNLITGGMFEKTFRAGEKVDKPDLEEKKPLCRRRSVLLHGYRNLRTDISHH